MEKVELRKGWVDFGKKLLVGVGLSADNPPGAVVEFKRREKSIGAQQEVAGESVIAHRHRTQHTLRLPCSCVVEREFAIIGIRAAASR
jgi:hypothetical protein